MLKGLKNHYPIIACQMTDKDVIEKLHNLIGGAMWYDGPRKAEWKPTWRVTVQGYEAIVIMKCILPHMGERRSGKIVSILDASEQYHEDKMQERLEHDKLVMQAANDYMDGKGSYRKLAKEYKLSKDTINHKVQELTS